MSGLTKKSSRQKILLDDAIKSVTNTQITHIPASVDYKSPFADIGKDVYWFVSGSKEVKNTESADRHVAVFGGDVIISGSLRVEGCELTGSFNFDCDKLELTGSIDIQGTGQFTNGISTSNITTVSGDPFFIAGTGIVLSSNPSTGQVTITSNSTVQNIEWNEKLTGLTNGVNMVFTMAHTPSSPETLMVFMNGILQEDGEDFTVSGSIVTFNQPPKVGSKILATYSR